MKTPSKLELIAGGLLLVPAAAMANTNITGTVRNINRNPLSNIEVTVQNGVTLRDTTDANGNYSISNVPDGNNASIYLIPLSNANWCARQDSLNLASGTLDFPAVLPDTFFVNSDSSNSIARVITNELKDPHIRSGKNPYLWNRKDIPFTISDRFSSIDTANIRTAIRWLNASIDTINLIKYVEGIDTTRSIYFRPGTMNWTSTATNGDSIYAATIELSTTDMITDLHEFFLHATTAPGFHVTTYSPSGFSDPTNVLPQPKDKAYIAMGYLLRKTKKDGINKLDMKNYVDSLTVGVEIEPQLVMPVKNELIVATYPNPVKSDMHVKYNAPKRGVYDVGLYNAMGQCVMKECHVSNEGENILDINTRNLKLSSGVYFLKVSGSAGTETKNVVVIR